MPTGRLDVYADNTRVIVPMDSTIFGRVMNVCIGAMMVGTICFTKEEGDEVERGEEYGMFRWGSLPNKFDMVWV